MTIKFQAGVHNGMIPIPTEYRRKFHDNSEVEVEIRRKMTRTKGELYDLISELTRNPIKFKDFTPLTSDGIYDRSI